MQSFNDFEESINIDVTNIISKTQIYILSQEKFWKALPYFAFMAEGITGWNDERRFIYEYKLFPMHGKEILLDINTLNIVSFNKVEIKNKRYLARMLIESIKRLDAFKHILDFNDDINKKPYDLSAFNAHRESFHLFNIEKPTQILMLL